MDGEKVILYDSEDVASDKKILKDHLPKAFSEPVMFCDLSDVIFKWKFWNENLPRVIPFYAVKCNYDPILLQTLVKLGAGFDCASQAEIEMVKKFDVSNQRIIFAQPVKFVPHLKFAKENRVLLVTFDRKSELEKCQKFFPEAQLIIRIKFDASDVLFKMGDKFGCEPEVEGPELLRIAKSMQLNVVGTSFHVGTGCNDIESYRNAIFECKKLTDYGRFLGYRMNLLDIGGGFHGTRDNNFRDIAKVINEAIGDFFPDPQVQVIAEPGQFFTTSAFTLFATVQASRLVDRPGCPLHMEYFINDGVYNTFRSCPEILQFLVIEGVGKCESERKFKSVIRGQCPDERDFITGNAMLPQLKPGDIIRFRNMGSYSLSMQSSYGRFEHPKLKYFIKSEEIGQIGL